MRQFDNWWLKFQHVHWTQIY